MGMTRSGSTVVDNVLGEVDGFFLEERFVSSGNAGCSSGADADAAKRYWNAPSGARY